MIKNPKKRIYFLFLILILFLFIASANCCLASEINIAVIGDSLSDEYVFYPPDRTQSRTWVEILSNRREEISFGEFSETSRGEPRNEGYEFNWALSGDTTFDAINQVNGLISQINEKNIDFIVVFIGANDFLSLLNNPLNILNLQSITDSAKKNISEIVSNIRANSDAKIVLVTTPEILGKIPIVVEVISESGLPVSLLEGINTEVKKYNDHMKTLAQNDSNIIIADLAGTLTRPFLKNKFRIGKVKVDLSKPSNDFRSFFLEDKLHFGTIAQCIIANEVILGINKELDIKIKLLTPKEIIGISKKVEEIVP